MTIDLDPYLQGHWLMNLGQRNHVCIITFFLLQGSFRYLVQIFTTKRRCVMYNDFWPGSISSKSSVCFWLCHIGQQNRVHAVTSFLPLEGSFTYLVQIFTTKKMYSNFELDPYLQGYLFMALPKNGTTIMGSGRYSLNAGFQICVFFHLF